MNDDAIKDEVDKYSADMIKMNKLGKRIEARENHFFFLDFFSH